MMENTISPFWLRPWISVATRPRSGRDLRSIFCASRPGSRAGRRRRRASASANRESRGRAHSRGRRPRRAPASSGRAASVTLARMEEAAVCQPEAHRPPNREALAAASSRWKGWGSNSRAKAMISSLRKVWLRRRWARRPAVLEEEVGARRADGAGRLPRAGDGLRGFFRCGVRPARGPGGAGGPAGWCASRRPPRPSD